eukprot:CAMPEP_0202113544 /NCGR_PEP_ID=MMETSP0965-20130614/34165_1 /ASSEMBLY_ACC=CAM_ASM_000507 /TAXON_ID=4773 /ORGANISM="Schizochytrium aggregatum, Strain ATCC28209" /LENGTH=173 /DNA_ID=CAMNT_0048683179 /DNA_START=749 /DNA_END=1270 /DNA_ORIENTATION=+
MEQIPRKVHECALRPAHGLVKLKVLNARFSDSTAEIENMSVGRVVPNRFTVVEEESVLSVKVIVRTFKHGVLGMSRYHLGSPKRWVCYWGNIILPQLLQIMVRAWFAARFLPLRGRCRNCDNQLARRAKTASIAGKEHFLTKRDWPGSRTEQLRNIIPSELRPPVVCCAEFAE